MAGPASDLVAQALSELGMVAAPPKEDKKTDPNIWIGSRRQNFPGGQSTVDQERMPLSTMQQKVLSAGARYSPSYYELGDKLIKSGLMSKRSFYPKGVAAGLGNAAEVYQAYSADGGTMNFTQWLDWYSENSPTAGGDGGRGGGYTGPTTTTSTTLTDEFTAEALLDKFARDLLGRGLTKQETSKYLKDFRKAEAESPQVTVSTPGVGTMTSVTETAASKDEILRQMIAENPDYQKFQVDTTIMDMLMGKIEEGKKVIYG